MPPRPRGDTRVSGIRVQPRRQSLTKKEPCRHLPPLTVNLAVGVEQSSKRGTSHRSRRINIAPPLHHTTRLALRSSRPALDGPEKHVHEAMSKHVHEAMSPSQNSPELTPLIDLFYESTNLRWDDGSWPVIGSRHHSERYLLSLTTAKRFDTTLIQVKIARFFVATYSENR